MDFSSLKKIKVIVKAGKKKTKIIDFSKNILTIEVAAVAQDNKANIELIKFLTRESKRKVVIKSGLTSKEKIIEFE